MLMQWPFLHANSVRPQGSAVPQPNVSVRVRKNNRTILEKSEFVKFPLYKRSKFRKNWTVTVSISSRYAVGTKRGETIYTCTYYIENNHPCFYLIWNQDTKSETFISKQKHKRTSTHLPMFFERCVYNEMKPQSGWDIIPFAKSLMFFVSQWCF